MYALQIDITTAEFDLLKQIESAKQAEYRDTEFANLQEYYTSGRTDAQWFLKRNFNGTFGELGKLFYYGFIDYMEDAWHPTVIVTDLGKKFIEQNSQL